MIALVNMAFKVADLYVILYNSIVSNPPATGLSQRSVKIDNPESTVLIEEEEIVK